MSIVYQLGPTSATAIELFPGDAFENGKVMEVERNRSSTGYLYQHIQGTYRRITVPIDLMPSSDAAIVNSWWLSQTKLRFFQTSGTTAVYSCMIMGEEQPMNQMNKPYDDRYKGTILLEGY